MNTRYLGWLTAGLAGTALFVAGCKTALEAGGMRVPAADSVYLNASVYTVDDDQPWAEAVAVRNGELVYVGSNEGVAAYADGDTRVTDLGGKMMLPGFVDSHMHPLMGGAYALALALDTFAGPEDWVEAVSDYAEQHQDKPVIFGYGFLASAFGADGPHKAMLDKVVSDRPVLLMDEGFHGAWANSKALEVLNITKDTPDIAPGFSYYKRGDGNEPTGYLLEGTAGKAMEDLDVITLESITQGSELVFNIMNSYGITAVFDAGAFDAAEHQVSVLKKLQDANKMHVRYVGSHAIVSADQIDGAIDRVEELRRTSKSDRFHVNMLKIMNDGTIEGKTAAMFEDYQGDPGNNGKTVFSQEQMNDLVSESAKRDIDVHIHALGERAVHEALNAVELAKTTHKDSISRYSICHVQVVTDESIKRFAELGVVAQSTPLWTSFDSQGQKYVSEDQFNRYFRYNSFKENDVTLAFGSDFPASGAGTLGMSPVFNMEIGHTRQETGERDAPIQPNISERLDIASLIRGYTLGSAYQLRMEDQIGSLEVGKKADFVVLDKNLFETDPYTFSDVKVTMTVMDGNVVYSLR
ncbi:amidohydrolase [Pseudomaricurvus alkylphenolicus]|uniref:amidohydrolase n=1 Tax=Pseudomaricurvus alkylphenolicus TaxID=1306991 RepID=UPI00141DF0B4|nr:amidohydrolase [Pseudomaricurvus alkylphenolicus]NIB38282.1 amidohydrolase [Pseudomaricurvus alkylphenolicus]